MTGPGRRAVLGRRVADARSMGRPMLLLVGIAFIVQVGVGVMLPLLPIYAISLGRRRRSSGS